MLRIFSIVDSLHRQAIVWLNAVLFSVGNDPWKKRIFFCCSFQRSHVSDSRRLKRSHCGLPIATAILLIWLFLLVQSDTNFASASRQTNLSSSGLENQQERNNYCLKYDYQIQDTLAATKPPFDNYFNISRAIYPSEELLS